MLVEQNDGYRFFSKIHELTSSGMLTQFLVVDVVSLLFEQALNPISQLLAPTNTPVPLTAPLQISCKPLLLKVPHTQNTQEQDYSSSLAFLEVSLSCFLRLQALLRIKEKQISQAVGEVRNQSPEISQGEAMVPQSKDFLACYTQCCGGERTEQTQNQPITHSVNQ